MLRNNLEGVFNRMGLTPYLSHVQSFKLFSNDGSIYDFIDSDFTNFIEFLDLSYDNKQKLYIFFTFILCKLLFCV